MRARLLVTYVNVSSSVSFRSFAAERFLANALAAVCKFDSSVSTFPDHANQGGDDVRGWIRSSTPKRATGTRFEQVVVATSSVGRNAAIAPGGCDLCAQGPVSVGGLGLAPRSPSMCLAGAQPGCASCAHRRCARLQGKPLCRDPAPSPPMRLQARPRRVHGQNRRRSRPSVFGPAIELRNPP